MARVSGPETPFSFVNDKILHGNSLLGLTDVRQLKRQHINPDAANPQQHLFEIDVDGILRQAAQLRRHLANEVNNADPQRSVNTKRRQWKRFQDVTAELTEIADAVVATGLKHGGRPGRALNVAYENLGIALGEAYPSDLFDSEPRRAMLEEILEAGLTPTVPTDYERWKLLHWIIAVPDVMERGGFDAIIGNPPFLGGKKVTPSVGSNLREWFVNVLASGAKGNSDLVGYFFLRAISLLNRKGNIGLIATNSVAQGDTREVGLDRMEAGGFTITRAIQSRSWPVKSATLEYAAVWGTRGSVSVHAETVADGIPAPYGISTLLEPAGRVKGHPKRLVENRGFAFIGSFVNCVNEFTMSPRTAKDFIAEDARLKKIIYPFLGGEDVNQRPACDAPRWIVDFTGYNEEEIKSFGRAYQWALSRVRPARMRLTNKPRQRERWWLYESAGVDMRRAIAGLDEALAITLVSKTVMPMRVTTAQVFSHALAVFATDSYSDQAVLSSSLHQMWAIKYGSGMRSDPRYTPSDVFETFPRPALTDWLAEVGRTLDNDRREIMGRRDLGLTKLYNLVNDPDYSDDDVARMREIHVELDEAVMDAYGWGDVELDHGFHAYRQMQRWTVSPAARVEILDGLLEENLRRAAAQAEAPPRADDEDEGDDE